MTTLIECLVERVSTTVAISFLQTPALAAVDRPAARQGPKVARHGLVVVVHAVRSRPIVTLGLGGITVADLSGHAVVRVASVLPRQAAVDILRRVDRLAQGLVVSAVIAAARVSLRGERHGHADVVTSLGTTQMFPQPLSYAATATAASNVAVLATVTLAGLVSAEGKNASVTIRSTSTLPRRSSLSLFLYA